MYQQSRSPNHQNKKGNAYQAHANPFNALLYTVERRSTNGLQTSSILLSQCFGAHTKTNEYLVRETIQISSTTLMKTVHPEESH